MVRSRFGLKALGLCALIFGLMAFAANAAQAEVNAEWTLINSSGQLVEALLAEVGWEAEGTLTILTEVSKKKVEISCTAISVSGSKLQVQGKITEGKMTWTGCTTKIGGVLQGVCKPHSKGAAEGTVVSAADHALLKLHAGTLVVLVLPVAGTELWNLILGKEGELNECSIGEKLPISGDYSLQACDNLTQHQVKHLLNEFPALTELWALNKTAEHKVTIDGSFWMFLKGEHVGLRFAGLA